LAMGILSVLGCRQYLRRLHGFIGFLSAPEGRERPDLVVAILAPVERVALGLGSTCDAKRAVSLLRKRQAQVESLGMACGTAGIVSFLLLLYLFDL
jgi:hypothetical protein